MLNYLLVPIYTQFFKASEYGVISELYAWLAFLIVFLTFGMETAFFRFYQNAKDKEQVYRNSFLFVAGINVIFLLLVVIFNQSIANTLLYPEHPEYILIMAAVISVDAITSLPMAKLRMEQKALRFATIQFSSIAVNIGLNLILMYVLFDPEKPEIGIIGILVVNLIASLTKAFFNIKDIIRIKFEVNKDLMKQMVKYSLPLVLAGFAGIINETIDRLLLKHVLHAQGHSLDYSMTQVGIYSACYKLAMLVTIFLQAYRFAAEPFFFSQKKEDSKWNIKLMNYFVAIVCTVFLFVSLNLDIFKYFIRNESYWQGLDAVPILLLANVFLGIYFNQGIWFKLNGKTKFGAYIAVFGALLTVILNLAFIPKYGYMACAWATLIVYAAQLLASYLLEQKYNPIKYNIRKFFLYFGLSIALYFFGSWIHFDNKIVDALSNNMVILAYIAFVFFMEKKGPKKYTTD